MISPGRILKRYGLRPKRGLGQHFLKDPGVVSQILKFAELKRDEVVVEVGAGLGALTLPLASQVRRLIALEVDQCLADILRKELGPLPNLEILAIDALKFSYRGLAQECHCRIKVIGNLPYQISTPLIFKLIEERDSISSMLLMFQKEVAARLSAAPGSKDYGLLSIHAQFFAEVKILRVVSARCFYPPPQVDSALVCIKPLDRPPVQVSDEATFFRVARAAFSHRRKTLENSLLASGMFDIEPGRMGELIRSVGLEPSRRAETFSLTELAKLSQALGNLDA